MDTLKQWGLALGYTSIFVTPALLLAGLWLDVPALAFAAVMLVYPGLRCFVGCVRPGDTPLWREDTATVLDRLPIVYAMLLVTVMGLVLRHLAGRVASPNLPIGLSLWVTLLFATCVAHELIHRQGALDRALGQCVAGIAGYPVLVLEHLAHHARAGDTRRAEWPRVDEGAWCFATRRLARILADAYGTTSTFWNRRSPGPALRGVRLATAMWMTTLLLFWHAAGLAGVMLYAAVSAAVALGVQLINYIQHWGLGDDRLGSRAAEGHAWEDDCRFQAWVTLGISLHRAHHRDSRRPYYRIALESDSPRLPAGYLVLMVLCLFPALWRRVMLPALEHWERHPQLPRSPGRRLHCFAPPHPAPTRSVNR